MMHATQVYVSDAWMAADETVAKPTPWRGARAITLVLPLSMLEYRCVRSLPKVNERVLKRMIAANPDRFFPLDLGELVTTAEWITASPDAPVARAYAIARSTLNAMLAIADRRGMRVAAVRPEGGGRTASLLPEDVRRSTRRAVLSSALSSLVVVAAWGVGAAQLAVLGVRSEARRLEVADPPAVASARRARDSLELLLRDAREVETDRGRTRQMINALADIGDALEQGGYLTSLTLRNGAVVEATAMTTVPDVSLPQLLRVRAMRGMRVDGPLTLEQRDSTMWSRVSLTGRGQR